MWRGIAVVSYLVVALLLLWPTPRQMSTHMPGGLGDPQLTCWYLDRNMDKFLSLDIVGFYESNMFYPHSKTAVYSEPFIVTSLMALVIKPFSGGNIIVVYNIILILSFALTAFGMHLLGRELGFGHIASAGMALVFAFAPARIGQVEHLHMVTSIWIPFAVLFFIRFCRGARFRDAMLFALFFLLNAFTSMFYMVALALTCLCVAVVEAVAHRNLWKKYLLPGFLAGAVMLTLAATVYHPYLAIREEQGFKRDMDDNRNYSAVPAAYVAPPSWQGQHLVAKRLLKLDKFTRAEGALLMGFTAYACAAFVVVLLALRRQQISTVHVWALLLVLTGVMLSLGPIIVVGDGFRNRPFEWFFRWFPGADGMRVPARLSIMALLGVSVLAGFCLDWLRRRANMNGHVAAILLVSLIGVESVAYPIGIEPATCKPGDWPPLYRWLKDKGAPGPILELPTTGDWIDQRHTFHSIFHKRPMLNGYSSYFPPMFEYFSVNPAKCLDDERLGILEQLGVRYVVAHLDRMKQEEAADLQARLSVIGQERAVPVWSNDSSVVCELTRTCDPGSWPLTIARNDIRCRLEAPRVVCPDAGVVHGRFSVTGAWANAILGRVTLPMNSRLKCVAESAGKVSCLGYAVLDDSLTDEWNLRRISLPVPAKPGEHVVSLLRNGTKLVEHRLKVQQGVVSSEKPVSLAAELELVSQVRKEGRINAVVWVKNTGETLWRTRTDDRLGSGEVKMGLRLMEGGKTTREWRALLPYDIGPGDQAEVAIALDVPDDKTDLVLEILPVVEQIRWFGSEYVLRIPLLKTQM